MATMPQEKIGTEMQELARRHLWMHFSRMGGYDSDHEIPVISRAEGCYVFDQHGKRYLDGLSALFCVNAGHGRPEIGAAAARQVEELDFFTLWSYAHPRAIELAARIASLAPGDLNRVFFTSGGSEAVESAWKLARQYYLVRGEKRLRGAVSGLPERDHDAVVQNLRTPPRRYKAITRQTAYHGTTLGALSLTGIPAIRMPFEPLLPEVRNVSNTNRYRRPAGESEEEFTAFLLDELERTIEAMGPETVCLVHMEPVQNSGGAFTPPVGYWQGVRAICDRYGILLCADEVICGFGRLGAWFGSARYDIRPDLITSAKGLSSSYGPIGALIATDRVMQPFLEERAMYAHGITFGGHPVMCAIAHKNIEIMKRERVVEHVAENEAAFRQTLSQLLDLPIVGDLRGAGFFMALELVKDRDTKTSFDDDESEWLLRGFLSGRLFERGLICRADDRGDPVIQLSPPLVAGQQQFDEIVAILADVLEEAWGLLQRRRT